jgi:hypothetical protein
MFLSLETYTRLCVMASAMARSVSDRASTTVRLAALHSCLSPLHARAATGAKRKPAFK